MIHLIDRVYLFNLIAFPCSSQRQKVYNISIMYEYFSIKICGGQKLCPVRQKTKSVPGKYYLLVYVIDVFPTMSTKPLLASHKLANIIKT